MTALLAPGAVAYRPPFGMLCDLDAMSDPAPDADPAAMTGFVSAGPAWGNGTLICSVQINSSIHHNRTNDAVSESVGSFSALVVMDHRPVNYEAPSNSEVYLCTSWRMLNGVTLYWDVSTPSTSESSTSTGTWTTNPETQCGATTMFASDPFIDIADDFVVEHVDAALCAVLTGAEGDYAVFSVEDDGDVLVNGEPFWNCPPYDDTVASRSTGGSGKGETGKERANKGRQVSDTGGDSGGGDPGGGGDPPPPYFPTGTIKISSTGPGNVAYDYERFTPARSTWTCAEAEFVMTCMPPPPPTGYQQNLCGALEVQVTNYGGGAVGGSTRCAGGQSAFAMSFGPTTTPTMNSAGSYSPFPWTCEATPSQPVPTPWVVYCTVAY